jgi:hypothetical protein
MKVFTEFPLIRYAKTVRGKGDFMKRFAFLVIASLAFVISGCVIEFSGTPNSADIIGDPRLGTNYQRELAVDAGEEYIICDDKETLLDYSFQFSGTLGSWRSYLEGKDSKVKNGDVTLNLSSRGVTYDANTNTVRVSYAIQPNAAPTVLAPTAIVETRIKGTSILYLEVAGERFFKELKVVENCLEIGL